MTLSPITATVLVDGHRVADTAAEFIDGASTVLTDAQVVWGRSTVVDQPETSTCTCTIARRAGGAAGFLAGLRVGVPLALTTSGTAYPDPTVSTFLDPGFSTGVGGRTPTNAHAAIATPGAVTAAPRANAFPNPHGGNPAPWTAQAGGATWNQVPHSTGGPTPEMPGWLAFEATTASTSSPVGISMTPVSGAANLVPVEAGKVYAISAYWRSSFVGTGGVTVQIQWATATGTAIGGWVNSPAVPPVANTWVRVTMTGQTAPVGAAFLRVVTRLTVPAGGAPVGASMGVSGVLVEAAAAVGVAFDGDTPDTSTTDYAWSGTAHATTSVAMPVGSTMRRNLAVNPSFEVNISGWTGNVLASAVRDTSWAVAGGASIRAQTVASGGLTTAGDLRLTPGSATVFPVNIQPGHTYTVSATQNTPAIHTNFSTAAASRQRRVMLFYSTNGSTFVENMGPQGANIVGVQRLSHTFTVPANATGCMIAIGCAGSNTDPSFVTYIDAVLIEETPTLGAYFDGDTPRTPTTAYAWSGAVGASTSVAITNPPPGNPRLEVDPLDAARPASVALAPAGFVPTHGDDPDAWDAIPATSVGQTWGYGARVLAPVGSHVEVRPVLYSGPWADAGVIVDAPLVVPADGTWHTVSGVFLPNVAGAWIGIEVRTFPTGPAWVDVPRAVTWATVTPAGWRWVDYARVLVDDVLVTAPAAGVTRTALVFSGRITDLTASFDDTIPGGGGVTVEVTAQDFTADLANNRIGDTPWPVQSLSTRVARTLALAGTGVTALIDPSIAATLLTYRDVDSQPAAGLITEMAESVDAVAWSATHQTTGPYYWLEDPARRPALTSLYLDPADGIVKIGPTTAIANALLLSACDVLRDPVQWREDVADTSTRVDVTWLEQGVDDDGKPTTTERHVLIVNSAAEATLGQRGVSLSTQLQAEADAAKVADRLLARVTATGWRLDGLTWDTGLQPLAAADITTALDLLDGTARIGRPVVLTDLPTWSPAGPALPLYIEGGSYTFTRGWWVFDLTTSSGVGGQGASATWAQLPPAWSWAKFDPGISWARLRGVGVSPSAAASAHPAPNPPTITAPTPRVRVPA